MNNFEPMFVMAHCDMTDKIFCRLQALIKSCYYYRKKKVKIANHILVSFCFALITKTFK